MSFSLNYLWHDLSRRDKMVITEFAFDWQMKNVRGFKRNYRMLEKLGANVVFGVDVERLYQIFKGHRFQDIYFANPYPIRPFFSKEYLISHLFESAAQVQKIDDCLHIVLPFSQEKEIEELWRDYGIVEAEVNWSYELKEVSSFQENGICVYPLYEHSNVFTFKNRESPPCVDNLQCYTFTKIKERRLSDLNPDCPIELPFDVPFQKVSVLKEPDFSFPNDSDTYTKRSLKHYMKIVQEKKRELEKRKNDTNLTAEQLH